MAALALLIGHASPAHAQPGDARTPPRPRRADAFWGLHFDFHAQPTDTLVGRTLTPAMVDAMLARVRPDYVQVDVKGHPGVASYPTRVGVPAASFAGDPLRVWRDATARRGVGLYAHYSGVIDVAAVRQHPAWASLDTAGRPDGRATSLFGPYVDRRLIPQLRELRDVYGLDGAWVDGDSWGVVPDYSPAAVAAWRAAAGGADAPRSPADPRYGAYLEFLRGAFRRYVGRYVDALHAPTTAVGPGGPRFEVASNWAYSAAVPEPVDTRVDFLSGDVTPRDAVRSAAYQARALAPQGRTYQRPWDLMAWSFNQPPQDAPGATRDWATKSAVQLQQELAEVMAVGGGVSVYFKQNRDASLQPWTVPLMGELGDFVRARRAVSEGSVPVPHVAVLHSSAGFKHRTRSVYRAWNGELLPEQGIVAALLDGQHSVELLMEHHLRGRMGEYPVIVVPEWEYLEPGFREELVRYAEGGGNLVVLGTRAVRPFAAALGVRLVDGPAGAKPDSSRYVGHAGRLARVGSPVQAVVPESGTEAFGTLHEANDFRFAADAPPATVRRLGRGRIAGVYLDLGRPYMRQSAPFTRDFLAGLVRALVAAPPVEVAGSRLVHVAAGRLPDGRLAVHLVNAGGPHASPSVLTYDELPPVGPLAVRVRLPSAPRRVTWEPDGRVLATRFEGGVLTVAVPRLAVHGAVVIR